MAPSWVLLDRGLLFSHDEAAFAGETKGGRESTGCASENMKGPPTEQDLSNALTAYLRSLKPDARLADPPDLSSLRMLHPTKSVPPLCRRVTSACISSADKHLLALYAGSYRLGTDHSGCHLIYDASKNSLSTIHRLPYNDLHTHIGCHSAVVVCDGDGDGYTLAELATDLSGDFALYLWYPDAKHWVVKAGVLPLPRPDHFSSGMCFHYRGTHLCWVDLLKGMVVCNLNEVDIFGRSDVKFRFIPLPSGCPTYGLLHPQVPGWLICGEQFRSMSCVGGVIKFITIDDYVDRVRPEELKLTLWTMLPDLSDWVESMVYYVRDIWRNELYQSTGMGKIAPSFPVLSMNEAHVVYLVFTDIRAVDNNEMKFRGQYVIRLDMENGEVQLCQASSKWLIHSQLFASEFSAYRHGSEDHPGGGSKRVTASGKRMKL